MREIKFRAWHKKRKCFEYWEFGAGSRTAIMQNRVGFVYPLEQFTGIKDKSGTEIYESDLLHTPHEPCSMVAWCTCGWMPFLRDQGSEPRFYLGRDVEVIGNIHEHPHLIQ